ncbi:MAG: hypothetical protein HY226_06380 [Candidatus Vogelbacteria bacterium]|nr:hypothetical protein [Candidatus Vogelbacteria bacterium]
MTKAIIIIIVAILIVLGVRSFAPAVPAEQQPVTTPVVAPVSAAEQEIGNIDLGTDVDSNMQTIDKDLNSL